MLGKFYKMKIRTNTNLKKTVIHSNVWRICGNKVSGRLRLWPNGQKRDKSNTFIEEIVNGELKHLDARKNNKL